MKKKKYITPQPVPITEEDLAARQFLTIPETAYLLRVTIRTVINMINRQQVQAVRLSWKKTLIPKTTLITMIDAMNTKHQSVLAKSRRPVQPKVMPKGDILLPSCSTETPNKKKRNTRPSTPKQTVTDAFVDAINGDVYTMAEICAKFNYTYGRFYNLRLRYEIPCVKGYSTKCFPKDIVDRVMAEEAERMGKANSEDWYTCFDIMKLYGLGKTQVRRFAETHGVRIRKAGKHFNQYLKADWEAARQEAESKSASTKSKRKNT